jgi:ATP sulfurylase
MGDLVSPTRRRDVYDRLRRRIEHYRNHSAASLSRSGHQVAGQYDQQRQETLLLQQRWLESKSKRSAKNNKANRDTQHPNNQITVSTLFLKKKSDYRKHRINPGCYSRLIKTPARLRLQ